MAIASASNPGLERASGAFPTLILVQGQEQRSLILDHSPFSVGRKVDKDLVIADPRVSRDHALITSINLDVCTIKHRAAPLRIAMTVASSISKRRHQVSREVSRCQGIFH